jgi:predicted MPP superfamily phosphohydrolase
MKETIEIQNNSSVNQETNIQKMNLEKNHFYCQNIIYFFISEYSWLLIICLIVFLSFIYPYYHPPKVYYSKIPKEPWNSDYTPKIFLHMTDIHISFYLGYRTNGSTNYFEDFLNYKPDLILNSGDVVDSYEESYWPKVGSQWPADWGIYTKDIKKNISKFKVIDVAGNHDLFAVDSLISKHN